MTVRSALKRSSLRFGLGLCGWALAGAFASRASARSFASDPGARERQLRRALRALRFVERVFPGITELDPFGEHYYRVRSVRHPRRVRPGQEFDVEVRLANLGAASWPGRGGEHPVRLGTWEPADRASVFHHAGTWPSANRAGELEGETRPGETGCFRMRFVAPPRPGRYAEALAPVAEMRCWFAGQRIVVAVDVV